MKGKRIVAIIAATLIAAGGAAAQDVHKHEERERLIREKKEMAQLQQIELREVQKRGFLGVDIMTQEADGKASVWIRSVTPGSGAEKAGVRAKDQLIEVNGLPLNWLPPAIAKK